MHRRLAIAALLALLVFTLAGCYTIEGIGRDLSAAGDSVSGAARETRESLEFD